MARKNQPYLPLYVNDWMNNTKLKLCSPSAHGVMISVMCLMHKEYNYGRLLLKQKFKQSTNQIKNFALQLSKLSAFEVSEIESPLAELVEEEVLVIDEDFLICNRMVKDARISENKAKSGRSGGLVSQSKKKNFTSKNDRNTKIFALADVKAKHDNDNETENIIDNENDRGGKKIIEIDDTEIGGVIDSYHAICTKLSRVTKVTEQRKSLIRARLIDYGNDVIVEVFKKVAAAKWMSGNNDRGWKPNLDWILKPSSFLKIYEGQYEEQEKELSFSKNR